MLHPNVPDQTVSPGLSNASNTAAVGEPLLGDASAGDKSKISSRATVSAKVWFDESNKNVSREHNAQFFEGNLN